MLACVSLLRVNRKAGTKPMCLWSWETHLGIFSALLWVKLHQPGGGGAGVCILGLGGERKMGGKCGKTRGGGGGGGEGKKKQNGGEAGRGGGLGAGGWGRGGGGG